MGYQDDIDRFQEKENLILLVKEFCGGAEPTTLRGVLRALSHPDIRNAAQEYLAGVSIKHTCLFFEAPWNCMRESDTRFENMAYGFLGGTDAVDMTDRWCQPCRERGWLDYEE